MKKIIESSYDVFFAKIVHILGDYNNNSEKWTESFIIIIWNIIYIYPKQYRHGSTYKVAILDTVKLRYLNEECNQQKAYN